MKKLFYLLVFTFLLFPFVVNAKEYEDKIYDIVEMEKSEVVTIYFFHSEVCIHCKHETEFLDKMKKKYEEIVMECVELTEEDILTVSDGLGYDTPYDPFE